MLVHLIASIPYIITPFSYKREIARSIISDPGFIGSFHATFLSDLFSNSAIYLSRPILALFYVIGSIALLIHYKLKKGKVMIFVRQHFMFKWLLYFLGFQLIVVLSHLFLIFRVFQNDLGELFFTSNWLQILSFIGLGGLIVTPFFFPQILYGLPSFIPESIQIAPEELQSNTLVQENKKISLNFEFDYMLSIVQKMATCMQEQKPYLQQDFNLAQFAVLIQVPTHHLAYFFREVKMQSFNDYRNECRVNHAKILILEGKASELTLEAIGALAGFANRNTFFTTFKKVEGIAPSTFMSQHIPV
ncbi:MAG: helix-turn-helix domain-containing protein [Mariniphaga sp.]